MPSLSVAATLRAARIRLGRASARASASVQGLETDANTASIDRALHAAWQTQGLYGCILRHELL